ncbi:MAG TPA: hypothetical protein ENI65_04255 [Gammaproteobacteria bacterium]|nr:hypothetical protein [Gammaproteobacteria bacterium]
MIDFRDRGPRRHSQHYVGQPDQVKVKQGVPLGRRSRMVMRNVGWSSIKKIYLPQGLPACPGN